MSPLLFATVLVFRGATLIDGTGAPPIRDAFLVVADGRIVSVGIAGRKEIAALPAGTETIDVVGKWIVPGFIDAHVHAESDDDLRAMLRWGVTSVRLMAEDVASAERLAADSRTRADVPEVFPAAPIFTRRGGWWDQGEPPDSNLDRFPSTAARARASVRRAKELGSAEVKLMLDDMAWCRAPKPALPRVEPDVARALIGEARHLGLRATVHAPELADAKRAVAYGATALAHGVLDQLDPDTVAVMKTRPVFYIPTEGVFEFLADPRAFVDRVLSDEITTRAGVGLPAATVDRYRSAAYAELYRARYPNSEYVRSRLPALRKNIVELSRAGVPVALGSDMWAFPGLAVSIEMDLYVGAGWSALQAIRAATQTAARSLGIERERGTLEAGRRADFLILSADPLADVKNVRRIEAVYKAGTRVGPRIQDR